MPIKIPNDLPAFQTLENENIFVIPDDRAAHQDIRALKIAIVNLMPDKIATETQLLRLLSNTPLHVDIDLIQMSSHMSKNTSLEHMLAFYKNFDEVCDNRYDGLIITGAPVEQMEYEDVDYWDELCRVFEWSKTNVFSTIHICWGAQAGLYYHYGVPKYPLKEKMFGNFKHHIDYPESIILKGFGDLFHCPHSRHTEVRREDIAPHAVNLVGIESPGLTAAVPIAQYVVELMKEHERLVKNDQFIPEHKSIRRFATASFEEKNALIRENKEYGEIICSCEQVTKAEIRAAIRNPLGVATMTGVKYRTRAMMGTCQGGFCQMKIEQLIEEELGIPAKDVRYSRPDSWVLTGNMREEK